MKSKFSLILVNNNQHWSEMNNNPNKWINSKEWLSQPRDVVGIMTGTSVDGADIVLAKFSCNSFENFSFELIYNKKYNFPRNLKAKILKTINNQGNTREISKINFELSFFYYEIINNFLKDIDFDLKSIDAIGIHGQTVWHEIANREYKQAKISSSLQLGSLGCLSSLIGLPVIGDFRSKDIAIGGEGAPLIPIFDYYFFRSEHDNIIALNIGGIANITYLPRKCSKNDVVAFDTGPGNSLIDFAMKLLFHKPYDKGGKIASKGLCNAELINELKKIDFIYRKPPKSTGKELFSESLVKKIIEKAKKKNLKKEDIITTFSYFTSWSIAENIKLFSNPNSKIIVSGGGARNLYLIMQLNLLLPKSEIILSDHYGIPIEARESLGFAFLAYLRLGNINSNLPSVTGAKKQTSLGIIAI